jgi:hypothetical protein
LQCSLPNKSRTFSHVQYTASVPVFLFINLTNHRLVNIPYNQLRVCTLFLHVCLHFLYTASAVPVFFFITPWKIPDLFTFSI